MPESLSLPDVLAAVPIPMVLIAQDSRVMQLNREAQAVLGDVVGRHYLTVIRQPEPVALIERVLQGGEGGATRWRMTGRGKDVVYQGRVAALAEVGATLIFEDISEFEQLSDMRRDFVANVSHELRTPLTALLGFIETLRGAAKDDPAARDRFLSIMERESLRMNRLVGDLLSLSRVEAEERLRPRKMVDLASLSTSVISTLRSMTDAMRIEVVLHVTPDLPPIPGDSDQLTQLLHNLIENAVKYGGSDKRIDVVLSHQPHDPQIKGAALSLTVIDQGEGIAPQHLPRLTERFYRVDTHRSREKGGTGLGLAIVKHIVQRHRGRLKIDSQLGEGSRFEVLLPLE